MCSSHWELLTDHHVSVAYFIHTPGVFAMECASMNISLLVHVSIRFLEPPPKSRTARTKGMQGFGVSLVLVVTNFAMAVSCYIFISGV